jgi:hypothetical protein
MILELENPSDGSLEIDTLQGSAACELDTLGLKPRMWEFGGLRKVIRAYRLPDQQGSQEFSFSMPLTDLGSGEQAIYIRMAQEDGHMAWSSPIYLVTAVVSGK